jgi:hypothetical protein
MAGCHWMAGCQQHLHAQQLGAAIFSLSPIEEATVRLKYYWLCIVKTTWGLINKNVWHVSTNFTDTILNLVCPVMTARAYGFLNITQQPNGGNSNLYGKKGTFLV